MCSDDDLPKLDTNSLDVNAVDDSEIITTSTNRKGRKVPDIYVRGLHENDILNQVQPLRCDRIHWDTSESLDIHRILGGLGGDHSAVTLAYTRQWSDGQHRIWVPTGEGDNARREIRALCALQGVEPNNLRIERNVPFRNLDSIDGGLVGELIGACVEWVYPRSFAVRQRVAAELDGIDHDDIKGMMYLFIHDLADRFDSQREGRNGTLNFTAFAFGKLKTWPQDLARATYGRNLVEDRVALSRIAETAATDTNEHMSDVNRADALGVSVTELRRREAAISQLAHVRRPDSISNDSFDESFGSTSQIPADVDVAEEALTPGRDAAITRAIFDAVNDPDAVGRRSQDPLALAATYLTFWEGLGRADVARQLGVMPKTVTAALSRTFQKIDTQGIEVEPNLSAQGPSNHADGEPVQ